ncbi:hypothetical protein Syun_004216 [Stephania yunnanensis]|uniref:Uncharacterized protein n=1 Tax=Stephania yunnanensis TaxID=152371 RepID=A0AAP0Q2B9_9MAGN
MTNPNLEDVAKKVLIIGCDEFKFSIFSLKAFNSLISKSIAMGRKILHKLPFLKNNYCS